MPSSGSGWNGNGGHSRGGPSNNGRHHSLPHQFGNSQASMMLNSYCTMTNSKSRLFFLSLPPFNQHTCVPYKSLFFCIWEKEKGFKTCLAVYPRGTVKHVHIQTHSPRSRPNNQSSLSGGSRKIFKKRVVGLETQTVDSTHLCQSYTVVSTITLPTHIQGPIYYIWALYQVIRGQ